MSRNPLAYWLYYVNFHKCGKNNRDITTFILVFVAYCRGSQSGQTMVKLKRTFDPRSYFERCLNHTSGT